MASTTNPLSRRAVLERFSVAASLPVLASKLALAEDSKSATDLWPSASILIGNGGTLIQPDVAKCQLYTPNGRALHNGTVTVDGRDLGPKGRIRFTWEVESGKLAGDFRFPDAKTVFALTPMSSGPPNYFLLISDDHVLATDALEVVAEGRFSKVTRVITKCQYSVRLDVNGVPHALEPFCTKCVYIFVRDDDSEG